MQVRDGRAAVSLRRHPLSVLGPDPAGPRRRYALPAAYAGFALLVLAFAVATGERSPSGVVLFGGAVPAAFSLFVLVLLGVALFHRAALAVAVVGAAVVTLYTAVLGGGPPDGLLAHLGHEATDTFLNLGGLLVGFALLAKSFEASGIPDRLPHLLPRGARAGPFALLGVVFVLSGFLDNIAAAAIGGVIARTAFQGRVSVAYLAAIVAASNAGGAGSIVGDTTTTMLWIAGVPALEVARATLGSAVALLAIGLPAAAAQSRVQPMVRSTGAERTAIDGVRLGIVVLALAGAIAANVLMGRPFLGLWAALLLGAPLRRPAWEEVPAAAKGAVFLLSLVWCASLMPVEALPPATPTTGLVLGFVSAFFDNIPLTRLAIDQGGWDWALLAYAVGFGGSMLWFGSSAGVALAKDYPEAKDTGRWMRQGWFLAPSYVLGFYALYLALGWNPTSIPER